MRVSWVSQVFHRWEHSCHFTCDVSALCAKIVQYAVFEVGIRVEGRHGLFLGF